MTSDVTNNVRITRVNDTTDVIINGRYVTIDIINNVVYVTNDGINIILVLHVALGRRSSSARIYPTCSKL